MKVEASITIGRPVEDVWKFMTDFSNYPRVDPTFVDMRQTSPGPLGVGTTLEARHQRLVYYLRVTEYEPNKRFVLEHVSGRFMGTTDILSMEYVEGKTKLTWTIDARLSGLFRLVGPLVGLAGPLLARGGARELNAHLGNIKRLLESEVMA
jgi:carbon monoxide dehydrogenase subunit G